MKIIFGYIKRKAMVAEYKKLRREMAFAVRRSNYLNDAYSHRMTPAMFAEYKALREQAAILRGKLYTMQISLGHYDRKCREW